nr:ribonuclease H-like domain-containing protein [Tanacetum cinerariifolium]
MYSYEQPSCLGLTFVGETLRKSDQLHQTFEKSSIAMTNYDEPIGDLGMMEDKVDNLSPQSTPQVFPSFEGCTPPVTYPKEVEETIGIPIEVEPLNQTKLEDLDLNTCSHGLFSSSWEFFSVKELDPQPLPNPHS